MLFRNALIYKRLANSITRWFRYIWIATQRKGSKSETWNGSKTRLYQIVHTTESLFLIVELAIKNSWLKSTC